MRRLFLVIAGLSCTALLWAQTAVADSTVPLSSWMPWAGDRFIVNVKENVGYLVHFNGSYTSFPVATGQRRTVHYIGLTYFAATPERNWTVKALDVKGKSITFGPTGRFLRLFYDNNRTSYGLHSHRDVAEMLQKQNSERYRSMGCILVDEEVLNILERTFVEAGPFEVITAGNMKPMPTFVQDVTVREI